jgi:Flp pilus assembly protein TadD
LNATNRRYAIAGVALVAVLFTIGSHDYAKTFRSSEVQWSYTVRHYPAAWPAHNNLGNALSDVGKIAEAGEQYREALSINPGYPEAHNNLGIIYARTGHIPEAITEFQAALYYCPVLQSAKDNLTRMREYQSAHAQAK